jgi:hypothetical protein
VGLATGAALLLTCTLQGASAAGPTLQSLVPTAPYRILDTRNGTGAPVGALGQGGTLTLQVAGVGPVPANATAVIINLTATGATAPTFITAWPTGTTRATTSVLNPNPGGAIANMITALLGNGRLDFYNNTGSVDLVADIAGYITAAPAATQTKVITGFAAHYDNSATSEASGCMRTPTPTPTASLVAQVDLGLPAGASITGVRVRYTSSAVATPINFQLMRTVVSGSTRSDSTASNNLVTITNSGPGSSALTLTNVGTLVSDTTYYWLDIVSGGFTTGFLEFCGVSVDYTMP